MLNGQKVKISTGASFDPVPMNRYTVQIKDVNLIKQMAFKGGEEDVLNYQFVILDDVKFEGAEGEQSTRGRFLWKRCRLAINDRSWWGKLITAAIGRPLAKEEVEDFDPESIINKQVDVMVSQDASKKDPAVVYNNIVAFSKTMKKLEPIEDGVAEKPVAIKKTKAVVPEEAPAGDDTDPDEFVNNLEQENKVNKKKVQEEEASDVESEDEDEEETPEELELKLKIAQAKAKAAKAKKAKK